MRCQNPGRIAFSSDDEGDKHYRKSTFGPRSTEIGPNSSKVLDSVYRPGSSGKTQRDLSGNAFTAECRSPPLATKDIRPPQLELPQALPRDHLVGPTVTNGTSSPGAFGNIRRPGRQASDRGEGRLFKRIADISAIWAIMPDPTPRISERVRPRFFTAVSPHLSRLGINEGRLVPSTQPSGTRLPSRDGPEQGSLDSESSR